MKIGTNSHNFGGVLEQKLTHSGVDFEKNKKFKTVLSFFFLYILAM